MTVRVVVDQLTVTHGDTVIIDKLSLRLSLGESLTILGETGAGKSVLAQAIMGDLTADFDVTGSVTVDGLDMLANRQQARALWGHQLVMLPQEPWHALSPLMSLGQQVAEVYRFVKGHHRRKANDLSHQALGRFGLDQAAGKVPAQLSGGMAQRGAFVCTNATGAPILLADEPTKGLDTALRHDVTQQLIKHRDNGCLLTITHDVEVARQLGGRVMVMQEGRIVEQGDTNEVFSQPESDYAQQLLCPPRFDGSKSANTGQPLLTANNLTLQRGQQTLFDQLNLTLNQGEFVGLYGPSGIGKSSLGDALLGLLPFDGTLTFHTQLARHQKLKLYQDPPAAFAPHLPLITLLEDVTARHNIPSSQISELADELGLSSALLRRTATEVSGGELQRVALLRVLLLKPQFLVADEPTSRLDTLTSQRITRLMVEKCRALGCTLLFISHDLAQLQQTCDRVIDASTLASPEQIA